MKWFLKRENIIYLFILKSQGTISNMPLVWSRGLKGQILQFVRGTSVLTSETTESEPAICTVRVTSHGVRRLDVLKQRAG